MLKVLIKLPLLSFTAMEDADLDVTGERCQSLGGVPLVQANWDWKLLHKQIGFLQKTTIASSTKKCKAKSK